MIFRETAKLHGPTTDRADFERFARALTAQLRPAAARINARIRRLMEEEHDQELRTEEYRRLLVQWAEATRASDLVKAA